MLDVQHLTKKYDKTLANDDLCFSVPRGRTAVLAGPNGAGKSTAIKCIMGLLRFRGSILIGGRGNKTVEAKRLLGYVPEIPALYDMLTVEEHMEFIARAYRLGDGWKSRAGTLLDRLELSDKTKKLGKELSKGMQQKVSVACALLPEPELILFDEPLVGLDPHGIKVLKEMLAELHQQDRTLLISTHMLESVEGIWDEVLIMKGGRIAAQVQKDQILSSGESLEALFFRITEGGEA